MTVLEILVLIWISIQLIVGVGCVVAMYVIDKKDQKRENHGVAIGSPNDGEESEPTMYPSQYVDCRMKTDTYMELHRWLRKNHPDLVVVGVPHYEDPEISKDFECHMDCCYNQDHVCMNPEGICGEQKEED